MRVLPYTTPMLILSVLLAACSRQPQSDDSQGMQMPPPEVGVAAAQPAIVPVSYEFIGQTVGSREVEVRARVTGHVDKRLYEEGALVKAGQPLFQLDARPLALTVASAKAAVSTAEADIVKAEAASTQAQRERDRLVKLAEAHAISRKEADDATSSAQISLAETQAAHARLEQAKAQLREAQLNLEYATIVAPIAGMAGRALRQEGSLVTASGDSLLTTLVQLDPLDVTFNIGDGERQRMNKDLADGTLVLPASGFNVRLLQRDGSELGHGGKINFVSSIISNQTGTQEMRAQLANPKGDLKSGLFVRVVLEGATRPNAITVPQRAVLEGPAGKMVMIVEASKDGKLAAQPRPIEVGDWTDAGGERLWVVQRGIKAGDQVIVDNLMKLRPGAPVSLSKSGGGAILPAVKP